MWEKCESRNPKGSSGVFLGVMNQGTHNPAPTEGAPPAVRRVARTSRRWLGWSLLAFCVGGLLALELVSSPPASAQPRGRRGDRPPAPPRENPNIEWPKDFEVGLQAAQSFVEHFGLVTADSVVARVNDVAYQVASQSGHPEYLFTFHVLDVPDANALALPGGFIFVTRGLLDLGVSDEALAHLLGHELAHVTERHFARADRINGLLSLLQTAALVAAIVAVPNTSGGYDYDPYTGEIRNEYSNKEAAITGTSIFGGLFRELLVRGYSRGLELEADEMGRRFAGRAGYPMSGGVELMVTLDNRIYEDQQYGYWRTHPYFDDRVRKARSALDAGGSPPDSVRLMAYRAQIQNRLSALAQEVVDRSTSLFLYSAALRAGPGDASTVNVAHRLLQRQAEWQRKEKPVLRSYGPLIADYDSLLAIAEHTPGVAEATIRRLQSERGDLAEERMSIYDPLAQIVDSPEAGTLFLELFLENFPEDARNTELRYRVAEQYRLTDRPDRAALELRDLMRDMQAAADSGSGDLARVIPARLEVPTDARPAPLPETRFDTDSDSPVPVTDDDWAARAETALKIVLPQTKDLAVTRRILETAPSDSVRVWSRIQLDRLAAGLDSLELGSRYLEKYPEGDVAAKVRDRMETLAHQRYLGARLHESLGRYQESLDEYNELILLAPGTKAAEQARKGIERVQTQAGR